MTTPNFASLFSSARPGFSNTFVDFFTKKLPASSDRQIFALLKRRTDPKTGKPGVVASDYPLEYQVNGQERPPIQLNTETLVNLTGKMSVEDLEKHPDLRNLVDMGRLILMTREETEEFAVESAAAAGMSVEEFLKENQRLQDPTRQYALDDYRGPGFQGDANEIVQLGKNDPLVDMTEFANAVRAPIMHLAQQLTVKDVSRAVPETFALKTLRSLQESLTHSELYYLMMACPKDRYAQVRKFLGGLMVKSLEGDVTPKAEATAPEAEAPAKPKRGRKPKTQPTTGA